MTRRSDAGLLAGITFALLWLPGAAAAQMGSPYAMFCRYVSDAPYIGVRCSQTFHATTGGFYWPNVAGPGAQLIPGDDNFLVNVGEPPSVPALCVVRNDKGVLECATRSGNKESFLLGTVSRGGIDLGYQTNRRFNGQSNLRFMADVNADGKADYCRFVGDGPNIRLSCALSFLNTFGGDDKEVQSEPGFDRGYEDLPRFMADVNADGKADYCRFRGDRNVPDLWCLLSDGRKFGTTEVKTSVSLDKGYDHLPRFMVDVDGDGQADFCRFVGARETPVLSCLLSEKTKFGTTEVKSGSIDLGYDHLPRFMVDVDGDGRADYCRFVGARETPMLSCLLSEKTKFGTKQVDSPPNFDPGYQDRPWFSAPLIVPAATPNR